jgi:hypothetical protein
MRFRVNAQNPAHSICIVVEVIFSLRSADRTMVQFSVGNSLRTDYRTRAYVYRQ